MMSSIEVLKQAIAEKEGARSVTLVNSFMLAVHLSIITLARAGDEILVGAKLLPDTQKIFRHQLKDLGIYTAFIETDSADDYAGAISGRTRFVFLAYDSDSTYDIKKISEAAHQNNVPLIVKINGDKEFSLNPLKMGADIIIRDLSPYSDKAITGAFIAESGKFNWTSSNVPLLKVCDPCHQETRWIFDLPKDEISIAFSKRLQEVFCKLYQSDLNEFVADQIKLPF